MYVVFHSIARIGHHITHAEYRWKFLKQKFDICRHRIRNGLNRKGWVYYGLVTLAVRMKRVHLYPFASDVGSGGVVPSSEGGPAVH